MHILEVPAGKLPVPYEQFIQQAIAWANQYPLVAYYNPNNISYPHQGFRHMLAVSAGPPLPLNQLNVLDSLRQQLQQKSNMLCGFFTYDVKNQMEKLTSANQDNLNFPAAMFFAPELYFNFNGDSITVYSKEDNSRNVIKAITEQPLPCSEKPQKVEVKQRVSHRQYIQQVKNVQQHILEGDVYELNYCMEFFAQNVHVEPLALYRALNAASPTPFSGYMKCVDKFLLCASPERFLKKEGTALISQPIKGTIRRGNTPEEDLQLQHQLRNDEKELAENMMIVDLVRNDLSRSCAVGTVQVEEMFGIYGFRQVSQMISTVTGQLRPGKDLVDALAGAFPMGSMTGAPKISAMQLIEELEETRRGLYSGTFGYITPEQDCDFNVVIRSLQYNAQTGYLSFMVGSAITYDSDPEHEYQECLLKAQAMLSALGAQP